MWKLLVLAALSVLQTVFGAELTLTLDKTLKGDKLTGKALKIKLVSSDNKYLQIDFTAPYFQGDGATNRVHLFLADDNGRISEVEFTPSSSLLRLYWAPFNVLRSVATDSDPSTFTASTAVGLQGDGATWTGSATVHTDLLPPRITKLSAANVHPATKDSSASGPLQYDNYYSITNYGIALPDLTVLPRYKEIGPRFLFDIDGDYSKQWQTAGRIIQ